MCFWLLCYIVLGVINGGWILDNLLPFASAATGQAVNYRYSGFYGGLVDQVPGATCWRQWPHISSVTDDILFSNLSQNKKLSCCSDSRSYCVRRTVELQSVVWNDRGQRQYLLIYSPKLKSAFDPCQRFIRSLCFLPAFSPRADIRCVFWLNNTSYSKSVWESE